MSPTSWILAAAAALTVTSVGAGAPAHTATSEPTSARHDSTTTRAPSQGVTNRGAAARSAAPCRGHSCEHRRDPLHRGCTPITPGAVTWVDSLVLSPQQRSVSGVPFGGISGLDRRLEDGAFVAISDDRSQRAPARTYELSLPFTDEGFRAEGFGVRGTTTILDAAGQAFAPGTVDPESVRHDARTGTDLWTDEGDASRGLNPALREMDEHGSFVRQYELPPQFAYRTDGRGQQVNGARDNLAWEGLALSPDGRTVSAMNEEALVTDGPGATVRAGTAVRLTQWHRASGRSRAQYVYRTEPISGPAAPGANRGVSEILQLSPTDYLAVERQFSGGRNTVEVFRFSTAHAQDVARVAGLTGGERAMHKERVLSLDTAGVAPDNVEGITLGPRFPNGDASLILVSDDNFNPASQNTVFHLYRVAARR